MMDKAKRLLTLFKQRNRQSDSATAAAPAHSFTIPQAWKITPGRLAAGLHQAEQGNIYEQASIFARLEELDTHLFAELSKRRRAVVGLPWGLHPPHDASQAEMDRTHELEQAIRAVPDLHDALFNATASIGYGYSCQEITYGKDRLPARIEFRPAHWFTLAQNDTSGELLLRKADGSTEALWPYKWLVHKQSAISGLLPNQPLFRVLAWGSIFKHFSIDQLLSFLDEYGMPIRIGKYPAGTSKEEQQKLLSAVRAIGKNGAGIINDAMQIELVAMAQRGGRGTLDFEGVIEWWERKQSIAILGGTLTSEAGDKGARSLGEVHDSVRMDLLEADATQLTESLNRSLIGYSCALSGMFPQDRCPVWAFDLPEQIDRQTETEWILKAQQAGFEIDREWAYKRLGMPKPGKDVLQPKTPQQQTPAAALAALTGQGSAQADPLDSIVNRAIAANQPAVDTALNNIYRAASGAGDLDAVLDTLPDAAVHLLGIQKDHSTRQALAVADLAGRAEVADDANSN